MAKVKIGIRGKTVPEKVQAYRLIVASMTGNTAFPTPTPTLASLTAAADGLETAFNTAQLHRQQGTQLTKNLVDAETLADNVLTQLGAYVESASAGDAAKIQSAGFDVRAAPSPITALPAPGNFTATTGDDPGEIDLAWDRVVGAKSYVIEKSTDATTWQMAAVATKSKHTLTGLPSGTKLWFRVRAIGGNSESPWSGPATKVVP